LDAAKPINPDILQVRCLVKDKPLKLTKDEMSFLRWLDDRNGQAALPGNVQLGLYDRLVKAGFVLVQADSFSMDTIHVTVTKLGSEALRTTSRNNGRQE
jgi:hypothetical protein